MRILLYEFVTGGGLWSTGESPAESSLLDEGAAMVTALANDLAACLGIDLVVFRDSRLPSIDAPVSEVVVIGNATQDRERLIEWARATDATWLIAPECDGQLANRCREVEPAAKRLVSPSHEFVELTSDKLRTNRLLRAKRIPVPLARSVKGQELPERFPYPAVLKPRDGAGSLAVQAVFRRSQEIPFSANERCLEQFHTGLATSVSVVSGPIGNLILPPCRQRISDDGRFQYLGGATPLEPSLAGRARRLASQVARALPTTVGYFGIDLVLGSAPDGSKDVVIEVNPRLTTSYLGLRRLAQTNLAAAILAVLEGQQHELSFSEETIEFSAT